MDPSLPDFYRTEETIQQVQRIAAGIFARYGVNFEAAKRAGGWTNATWLAGGLALRIAVQPGSRKILREVQLAALLPAEVGYPAVLESGVSQGYEWSLAREVPGAPLGDVWDDLSWDERVSALQQLWRKAQAVHRVDLTAAAGLVSDRAWFNSNDPGQAEAHLQDLEQQKLLTVQQAGLLREALARFWEAIPGAGCVVNHGDLTLDNAHWHAGRVVSLMDFEFAVMAPEVLDLNTLLKIALRPVDLGEVNTIDCAGQEKLRAAAVALAAPVLSSPGTRTLFLGYAILLELWLLIDWLAHPEGEGPLEQWQPYRRLLSLADGQGGYLAPLMKGDIRKVVKTCP